MSKSNSEAKCWICGNDELSVAKESNVDGVLTSEDFSITDAQYGSTGKIYCCNSCGFLQCSELNNVLDFYENLEDSEYESGREPRSRQSANILKGIKDFKESGRLLDVGAGSGILVEKAIELGFSAEGLEPSKWLCSQATKRGLPVTNSVLPMPKLNSCFDVVTLIDVIEHVPNPNEIFSQIAEVLRDDGIGVVVTPDVSSVMARILGWRWWHYRIAHIGYFNLSTLKLSMEKAGLKILKVERPSWYFPVDYLIARVNVYLPKFLQFPVPKFTRNLVLPLNLRDSVIVYFERG